MSRIGRHRRTTKSRQKAAFSTGLARKRIAIVQDKARGNQRDVISTGTIEDGGPTPLLDTAGLDEGAGKPPPQLIRVGTSRSSSPSRRPRWIIFIIDGARRHHRDRGAHCRRASPRWKKTCKGS